MARGRQAMEPIKISSERVQLVPYVQPTHRSQRHSDREPSHTDVTDQHLAVLVDQIVHRDQIQVDRWVRMVKEQQSVKDISTAVKAYTRNDAANHGNFDLYC